MTTISNDEIEKLLDLPYTELDTKERRAVHTYAKNHLHKCDLVVTRAGAVVMSDPTTTYRDALNESETVANTKIIDPDNLFFTNHLPDNIGKKPRVTQLQRVATAIKAHPGFWAAIGRRAPSGARTTIYRINKGMTSAFTGDGWEAIYTQPEYDGKVTIYVRYTAEKESTDDEQ